MRSYRIRRKSNATIKAFYKKQRILAAAGVPCSLKVTLLGVASRRGGWRLRWEKLRRKLQPYRQLKGTSSTSKLPELEE